MSEIVAYRLRHNLSFGWLTCVNEADFDLEHTLAGRTLDGPWKAPQVVQLVEEGIPSGELGDFPTFGSTPVFSAKAVRALEPLLRGNGELLRLNFPAGDYYVFNVTAIADVLDEQRSILRRFSDGRVMHLAEPRFDRAKTAHAPAIYKIPQQLRSEVFVRPDFPKAVETNGLRGFAFDPVYG